MSDESAGRFVWYQLNTSDPAAAERFYGAVAGWGGEAFEGGGAPYTMLTVRGQQFGGIMQLPDEAEARPHWLGYVSTDDVDATAARVQELGGTIMVPPTDIPDVGRFAVFADPQGALLATYKSSTGEPEPPRDARPGEISWHELHTTDYEAATDFYSRLLGWEVLDEMDMGEAGSYRIYGRGERQYGGMFNSPAGMPPMFVFYVKVEDLDATMERVQTAGGQVVYGPEAVPGGRIAQCIDPQGAMFALHVAEG